MTREPTNEELEGVEKTLRAYATAYLQIPNIVAETIDELVDGSASSIEKARYSEYESLESHFGEGILEIAIPLLVLKALVTTNGWEWVVVNTGNSSQMGASTTLLPRPITAEGLANGEWIEDPDFDESPTKMELAIESFDAIQHRMAKTRIFRGHKG